VGQPVRDRRRDPRYIWSPADITQATLRPGCVVHVVDLGAGGALVQAARPLRPGAQLHFHLVVRRQRFSLSARVLRCEVWALDSRVGVTYRGALQFEERLEFGADAILLELPIPALASKGTPAWGAFERVSPTVASRAERV
jgi:hypothetical protein